ncbi:protein phosphatase 2C domain-containing protein [Streptomyces griseoviridis]|uniref:protein phosphatase 2C domain-containing protein n=1 Tax=Streptomyces griseoviridis TaxID=45398 RepID=UPI0033D9EEB2
MSQQGEGSTGPDDDWWGQLYDDSTQDTGPAAAPDSLDDRFASAAGAVKGAAGTEPEGATESLGTGTAGPGPTGSVGAGTLGPGPTGSVGAGPRGAVAPGDGQGGAVSPPGDGQGSAASPPSGWPTYTPRTSGQHAPGAPRRTPSVTPGDVAGPAAPTAPVPPAIPVPPAAPVNPGTPASQAPPVPPTPPVSQAPAAPPAPVAPPVPPVPPVVSRRRRAPWEAPSVASPAPATFASASGGRPGSGGGPAGGSGVVPGATPVVAHVGSGPPTYDAEPTALPVADPDRLDDLVPDTVLDGARFGTSTVRAVSVRGDSARYRGEPRRDALLTARFGTGDHALLLVATATGARATPGAHRAAAEACHWIGRAVGRSHARLSEDIRAGRRGDLKSGLHRLTDRTLGRLRASAVEQGVDPDEYAASLRCLLLPADPDCRTRIFFGVGTGGLFRLRDGDWQDIEPRVTDAVGEPVVGFGSPPAETPEGDRLTLDLGIPAPPSPYEPAPGPPRAPFRFRASVARPGDTLLMCSDGLAEPLRGEPELCRHLSGRWAGASPPGLAAFLADAQVRVKGYSDDRTAAAVWEA